MATFTCTFNPSPKATSEVRTDIFHPFPKLPFELRTEIFQYAQSFIPSRTLNFHILKSDLDILHPHRRRCHDHPHIRCSKYRIPPLLHACRESRAVALQFYTLGFDGGLASRTMKMGRGDTDVETFTTCSYEVIAGREGRGVYWQQDKNIILLEEGKDANGFDRGCAYVWGGATGLWSQSINKMAVFYETFLNLGLGTGVLWDSIEELTLYNRGWWFDRGRGVTMPGMMTEVKRMLKLAAVRRSDGSEVRVRYVERISQSDLVRWLRAGGVDENNPHQDYGTKNLFDVADGAF